MRIKEEGDKMGPRKTGIKDMHGKMIVAGDIVCWPKFDKELKLTVIFIGDGGDMDWAADWVMDDGKIIPDSWLDSGCEIV